MTSCGGQELGSGSDLPAPVSVWEIRYGAIEEYINATGTLNPLKEAELKSKNQGYYNLIINPETGKKYRLGDNVAENGKIIHLENSELVNNIKIESKKLELETSRLEYEKQKSLYEKGGVTYRELKDAERNHIDARYNYQYALEQLSTLEITAPFSGVIVKLPYFTEGTEVESGASLAGIMDFDSLYLELNIPGREFEKVRVGQTVQITHYSLPEDSLTGTITEKSPVVDADTRSFMVRVQTGNPGRIFKPGMFVKADITVARADSAVVIPKDVIQMKDRGKTVFVVEKGAAIQRIIQTGLSNPDSVQVVEGLKLNERLVVKGFETLKNRSKVKVLR
jgi:RND family efflux transporter MFP subunit